MESNREQLHRILQPVCNGLGEVYTRDAQFVEFRARIALSKPVVSACETSLRFLCSFVVARGAARTFLGGVGMLYEITGTRGGTSGLGRVLRALA